MAYTAGNLHLRAGAVGNVTYTYNATTTGASDTLAELLIAGYFNNTDDDLNLAVDDVIFVRATDGYMTTVVSDVTAGSVTLQFAGGTLPPQTPSTGTFADASIARLLVGHYEIASAVSTASHYFLPTPYPGAEVLVRRDSSQETAEHYDCGGATTVTLDARGNRRILLTHEGESFHVVGVSATRWRIMNLDHNASGSGGASLHILTSTGV
jgi:hypothetical protein